MIKSEKLIPEREAEIAVFEDTYDDQDLPVQTREEIMQMRPRNPESFVRQRELDSQIAGPFTVTLDTYTACQLLDHAKAAHKTPAQVIGELVREKLVTAG
jgi:hypothetical protein